MAITELAEGTDAEHLGELIGLFGIPIVGLILLITGLVRSSRSRQQRLFQGPPPEGFAAPNGPVAGYPQFPGPPPYPAPYPPSRRAASSGTALIVTGAILLGVGVLGFIGRLSHVASESQRSAHVGQCLNQSDFQNEDLTAAPRDCALPDSLYEVAAKGDGSANCPDGKLADSKYAVLRKGSTTLCLMLNLRQGQCYTAAGTADNPSFTLAVCAGAEPRIRVVTRDEGSSDAAGCPSGTRVLSYPTPPRLYCLERLAN